MKFVSISSLQKTTKPMIENDVVCVLKNNEPAFYTLSKNKYEEITSKGGGDTCSICCNGSIDWRISKDLNNYPICTPCAENISNSFKHNTFGGGFSKKKISEKLRHSIYSRDGFKCLSCGSIGDLTCDHIIPESKGGEATFDNLQTLCRSCNSKKGVKCE